MKKIIIGKQDLHMDTTPCHQGIYQDLRHIVAAITGVEVTIIQALAICNMIGVDHLILIEDLHLNITPEMISKDVEIKKKESLIETTTRVA